MISKKAAFEHLKREIQSKEKYVRECEGKIMGLQTERKSSKEFLDLFQESRKEKEQEFNALAQQEKSISAEIAQSEEQIRNMKEKYAANRSFEVNAQTDADFNKLDELSLKVQKLNSSLADTRKRVELAASSIEKNTQDKKKRLSSSNLFVQQEEKQTSEIKATNEAISQAKRKLATLEQ